MPKGPHECQKPRCSRREQLRTKLSTRYRLPALKCPLSRLTCPLLVSVFPGYKGFETKPAFYSSPLSNEEIRAVYRQAQEEAVTAKSREATANVGADAFLRPAAAKQGVPAAEVTKNAVVTSTAEAARLTPSRPRTNAPVPTQTQTRKPPVNTNATAKTATHPKEREHRASAG